ncbi:putative ribonuclease H-like domain-containing protein [Tanacetum coccineum]
MYVDDIIFGSIKKSLYIEFEKMMHKKFQMSSMGELTFFLGLQVKPKEDRIFISQDKYVTEILNKFGFTDVKTASTPMETHKPLLKDTDGEDVDENLYRSMIGSLMYLTSSRPDIMFAVCACARYQVNPKVSHFLAVKRIFRYLKGQPKLGFWYPKDSPFDLVAYTDSDYARASLDRKSTTGAEAEYIAASNCYGQLKVNAVRHNLQLLVNVNAIEVTFLEKPTESEGFEEIVDFLNANPIKYALTVNLTIYCSCVKQFWDTVKAKTVNAEVQLQALVDKKMVIITESTIRRDLQLEDANEHIADEVAYEENVPTQSNDPPFLRVNTLGSGEKRLSLKELMNLFTKLSNRVLDLETSKTTQAKEIASLKKRVKKLERKMLIPT